MRRALFLVVALSLVLTGLLTGFVLIYLNLQRTLNVETQVRADKFADMLQAGLVFPLWEMTPASGEPLLQAVAADPSVNSNEVLDSAGKRLLSFHRDAENDSMLLRATRQVSYQDKVIGQVSISYSTAMARGEATRASERLLMIVAIQFLVSLTLIGTWLSRRVLTPLDKLRACAEKIAGGDLQSEVPVLRADEFGVLAEKLEAMRNSLAQSVTQLENRVEVRTKELHEVNTQLQTTLENLRQMQDCLVQAEKLASLGSLVAGVAHELNTPIGTALTVVSTMCDRCTELRLSVQSGIRRSQLDAFMEDVEASGRLAMKNIERAAQLVQDFKQVAVDQMSSRKRQFELSEMVREMLAALRFRHKNSAVRIEAHISERVFLDSYPGSLEQVITNLVENAVIHGADGREECVVEIAGKVSGDTVTLTITDNGNGIDEAHLSKIFDPFFTTRLGKGGAGLGLSIVFGLVTGMLGGQIFVTSKLGQGTRFTLELPAVGPEHPEMQTTPSGPSAAARASITAP